MESKQKKIKLIIQIPCFNEEHTLPHTFEALPRKISGVDEIKVLVIDDCSTDATVNVAKELGVDYILENKKNMGLARSFRKGVDACLQHGADIIVNTDGDNQYDGRDIEKLIFPVLNKQADIAIGDRETAKIPHFSVLKKVLQRWGSFVVRQLSGVDVPDAVSGFRAISREAAIRLNIVSSYTYTTEMIIQAGIKHMVVSSVPVRTNPKTRPSRLFSHPFKFVQRQATIMLRMYAMYKPLHFFFYIGSVFTIIGLVPVIRFMSFYFAGAGEGHIQSLVLGGVFLLMGLVTYLVALVADLQNFNRQLIEMTLEKVRRMELKGDGENDPNKDRF